MALPLVLFNGIDAAGNFGLWATNGTVAGTSELTGISNANANGINPSQIAGLEKCYSRALTWPAIKAFG
jgi:ELWxxDGT repeat protein